MHRPVMALLIVFASSIFSRVVFCYDESPRQPTYDYYHIDLGELGGGGHHGGLASKVPVPRDVMVDLINNLGIKLLAIHNERNDNNIAISPYGALSVLAALSEGVQGDAAHEILHAGRIPKDKHVIRVGLRDIHRHLKSYFIPEEGFLAGLTLNLNNVSLRGEYEDVLRFYGFDYGSFNNALYPEPLTTPKPLEGTTLGTTLGITEGTATETTQKIEETSTVSTETRLGAPTVEKGTTEGTIDNVITTTLLTTIEGREETTLEQEVKTTSSIPSTITTDTPTQSITTIVPESTTMKRSETTIKELLQTSGTSAEKTTDTTTNNGVSTTQQESTTETSGTVNEEYSISTNKATESVLITTRISKVTTKTSETSTKASEITMKQPETITVMSTTEKSVITESPTTTVQETTRQKITAVPTETPETTTKLSATTLVSKTTTVSSVSTTPTTVIPDITTQLSATTITSETTTVGFGSTMPTTAIPDTTTKLSATTIASETTTVGSGSTTHTTAIPDITTKLSATTIASGTTTVGSGSTRPTTAIPDTTTKLSATTIASETTTVGSGSTMPTTAIPDTTTKLSATTIASETTTISSVSTTPTTTIPDTTTKLAATTTEFQTATVDIVNTTPTTVVPPTITNKLGTTTITSELPSLPVGTTVMTQNGGDMQRTTRQISASMMPATQLITLSVEETTVPPEITTVPDLITIFPNEDTTISSETDTIIPQALTTMPSLGDTTSQFVNSEAPFESSDALDDFVDTPVSTPMQFFDQTQVDVETTTPFFFGTTSDFEDTTPFIQNNFDYNYNYDTNAPFNNNSTVEQVPPVYDDNMANLVNNNLMPTAPEGASFNRKVGRKARSVVDYVIARYYDDHQPYIAPPQRPQYAPPQVPQRPHYLPQQEPPPRPQYIPQQEPLTFAVYGKYRESGINFMKYDTVLPFFYVPNLNALALSFPLDSTKYYLLLLLPVEDNGVDQLICDLRLQGNLRYIIEHLRLTHVIATIPSFRLKGYVTLTPALQRLGIRRIFEPRQADFSPMTNVTDIYVTNIEQAVTVTIRNYLDPSAQHYKNVRQYPPVQFKADHPFLYFVIDSDLHVALMVGKVINPLNSRIR